MHVFKYDIGISKYCVISPITCSWRLRLLAGPVQDWLLLAASTSDVSSFRSSFIVLQTDTVFAW